MTSNDHPISAQRARRLSLFGRRRECDELRAYLADALAGRSQLVLLAGEPGIGKTRLADELSVEAAARGAVVAWGRCWEAGGAPVYWPWIEILRACARECPPDSLEVLRAQHSPHVAAFVAQFLPGQTPTAAAAAPDAGSEGPGDRFHVFDAVATFLGAAASEVPLMLILDDAHAADLPSLHLLRFVARALRKHQLLILVTHRETEVRRHPQLAEIVADLGREGVTLPLRGLSEDEVHEWVASGVDQAVDNRTAAAVHRVTDGNPFFVSEIVRLLASSPRGADGAIDAAALSTFGIPDGVRVAIRQRVALASPDAQRALTVGAVVGREFDLALLRDTVDLPPTALAAAMDDACACGLIVALPDVSGRYRFTHVLIAETLYGDVPTAQRLSLHLSIARRIEADRRGAVDRHLAELAHHYARSLPLGPVEKAVEFAHRGARHAEAVLAYEEAARLYEAGVTALESTTPVDEALRCDLLLGLGESAYGAGRFDRTRQAFERAADSARRLGSCERLARAALGFGMPPIAPYTVDRHLVALLEDALRALGETDAALRARVLARLGAELHWSADRPRGATLSHEAVEMARRLGDSSTLAYALFMRHLAAWSLDNLDERLAIATEIVELAEHSGSSHNSIRGWKLRARYYRFVDLLELGATREADAEIERYHALAEELRQHHGYEELALATRALMEGRLPDAERYAERALDIARRLERREKPFRQAVNSHRLILRREQGRLEELLPLFRAPRTTPRPWVARCALAFCYAALDRRSDAAAEWGTLAASDFEDIPRDPGWMAAMVLLSEVCAYLRDVPRARRLYVLLAPYADRNATLDVHVCYGSVAHYLGLLAATMRDDRQAEVHFDAALRRNLAMGATLWATRSRAHYAALLLERDRDNDRARAAELCALAQASATALGLRALAVQVAALSAAATASAPPDGTLTILFTDLQDSTGMTDRLGDLTAQEFLREHNAIVRDQIAAHRGVEVKTTGDGFMIAFASARRAVQCAIAIQQAFAARNSHTPGAPLSVTMGLHTGEAIWEAGDYYGKAVIVAARLAAAARGGEILASATVKSLTDSAGDLSFDAGHELTLKGFTEPHRVHVVRWQTETLADADAVARHSVAG